MIWALVLTRCPMLCRLIFLADNFDTCFRIVLPFPFKTPPDTSWASFWRADLRSSCASVAMKTCTTERPRSLSVCPIELYPHFLQFGWSRLANHSHLRQASQRILFTLFRQGFLTHEKPPCSAVHLRRFKSPACVRPSLGIQSDMLEPHSWMGRWLPCWSSSLKKPTRPWASRHCENTLCLWPFLEFLRALLLQDLVQLPKLRIDKGQQCAADIEKDSGNNNLGVRMLGMLHPKYLQHLYRTCWVHSSSVFRVSSRCWRRLEWSFPWLLESPHDFRP